MLNPTAGNWKGKIGFFWGGFCVLCLIWTYYRLPELKGRTYEELDLLFLKRVSARRFKSTFVDAYAEGEKVLSYDQGKNLELKLGKANDEMGYPNYSHHTS